MESCWISCCWPTRWRRSSPSASPSDFTDCWRGGDLMVYEEGGMRTTAVTLFAAVLLGGCSVDTDFANTRFQCADGACPDGYQCVDLVCVLPVGDDGGGGQDDGGGAVTDASGGADASGLVACD